MACKLQTVWKCFCINHFSGQCSYKMKARKYMSLIQRITWLSWNNLCGFHSLSYDFFFFPPSPLTRGCKQLSRSLDCSSKCQADYFSFILKKELKWMVIMGQIHVFWKAEVHKNRVNYDCCLKLLWWPTISDRSACSWIRWADV